MLHRQCMNLASCKYLVSKEPSSDCMTYDTMTIYNMDLPLPMSFKLAPI